MQVHRILTDARERSYSQQQSLCPNKDIYEIKETDTDKDKGSPLLDKSLASSMNNNLTKSHYFDKKKKSFEI